MQILSTNISKVKTVDYNGKQVKTGIFKQPTEQSVEITTLQILGDEQADLVNHGGVDKAIYAFSAKHYEHWRHTLENNALQFGAFGENFTVSDLPEDEICIGDQLQFGSAILEVSQPRIPCFKLALAVNDKRILKLFTQYFYTGVYFRVIQTGQAKTSDKVTMIKKAEHDITVKTLFQAYFDKSYPNYEQVLQQALLIPELAQEWRGYIEKKLGLNNTL